MILAAATEVAAPAGFAFDLARDFRRAEARAREAGHGVARREPDRAAGERIRWRIEPNHPRLRAFTLALTDEHRPERMDFTFRYGSFAGSLAIRFAAIDDGRCRLAATLKVEAMTLRARIVARPLLLARGRIERGFEARLHRRARQIEAAFRAGG